MEDRRQQDQRYATLDVFDLAIGSLHGIPDVEHARPTTLRAVMPIVGNTETFIIQTYRHRENGDTIFVEHVSAKGTVRMVLPPKVAELIARQRDALSKRIRSSSAKEVMAQRMRSGFKPNFQKKGEAAKATKRRRLKPTE